MSYYHHWGWSVVNWCVSPRFRWLHFCMILHHYPPDGQVTVWSCNSTARSLYYKHSFIILQILLCACTCIFNYTWTTWSLQMNKILFHWKETQKHTHKHTPSHGPRLGSFTSPGNWAGNVETKSFLSRWRAFYGVHKDDTRKFKRVYQKIKNKKTHVEFRG